ncbi:MAG: DUF4159 domain-containing protein [Paracoccaceae bacterium]
MTVLGPVGFAAPWLLLALLALPVLWVILRAVPPAAVRRRFPGVALLLGLRDDESVTDRTPWWLLVLRMLAAAAVIVAFAGPILDPDPEPAGSGPLLVVMDGGWASAPDWDARLARAEAALDRAGRVGRPVALVQLTDPAPVIFADAAALAPTLAGLTPRPWAPLPWDVPEGEYDTLWIADGLAHPGRDDLMTALSARGSVTVVEGARPVLALRPPALTEDGVSVTALRALPYPAREVTIAAIGPDPSGTVRRLAAAPATFEAGAAETTVTFELEAEVRDRVARFAIPGTASAGAVAPTGDTLARAEVALIRTGAEAERPDLLQPLHYLRQALATQAEVIEGTLSDMIAANPDVIALADAGPLPAVDAGALGDWVEAGGTLLRFAGPRMAAAQGSAEDPLMPVRLRAGGRSVGGAMSWGEPRALAPFPEASPFAGLPVPSDVAVTAQVLAEPGPELAERTIAALADGTPLVTRAGRGAGRIVLFHVTADAEWSSLPLSGLFVSMLERLAVARAADARAEAPEGSVWAAAQLIDWRGDPTPGDELPGVPAERLSAGTPGPDMPPGTYTWEDRARAVTILGPDGTLEAATWPPGTARATLTTRAERPLAGLLLAAAIVLLAIDAAASLMVSGRLRGAAVALLALTLGPLAGPADAQDDALALRATSEVVLAHVLTGDDRVDDVARAGLDGIGRVLTARTSIEPGPPVGVDPARDELSFFPFLYWPVTADQPIPGQDAYDRLQRYLAGGGMILFDTRDADVSRFGATTPAQLKLQALARPLDIPPLEPLPRDHVLTRTFYLIQDTPGRHEGAQVWVEASSPDAAAAEGVPFRDLNDGVTPVVIGGGDWAAAWAVDAAGREMLPVGRGMAGERQREIARRFGVNLVMHVLTGNYKSDQVHVPALLDRLGQ